MPPGLSRCPALRSEDASSRNASSIAERNVAGEPAALVASDDEQDSCDIEAEMI
jgi:hypothetical protein